MSYYLIIRGPLGCGKSTLSKKVCNDIHAEYIPIDRILDEHKLTKDWEQGYISQKSFLEANRIASVRARRFLSRKKPVVFDGNFYWKSQIDDLISRLDFPHYVFTLHAPLEVCISRDRQRLKSHGRDAAESVYKKSVEFNYGVVIDVSGYIDDAVDSILSHIKEQKVMV